MFPHSIHTEALFAGTETYSSSWAVEAFPKKLNASSSFWPLGSPILFVFNASKPTTSSSFWSTFEIASGKLLTRSFPKPKLVEPPMPFNSPAISPRDTCGFLDVLNQPLISLPRASATAETSLPALPIVTNTSNGLSPDSPFLFNVMNAFPYGVLILYVFPFTTSGRGLFISISDLISECSFFVPSSSLEFSVSSILLGVYPHVTQDFMPSFMNKIALQFGHISRACRLESITWICLLPSLYTVMLLQPV